MSIERKAETDRDRFEAHYRKTRGGVPDYVFDKGLSNNRYFNLAVQLDWELWQTAIIASGRDDLLEACELCLGMIEATESRTGYVSQQGNVARAAIAKAKGEQ
jgi:hypothetical protein